MPTCGCPLCEPGYCYFLKHSNSVFFQADIRPSLLCKHQVAYSGTPRCAATKHLLAAF